MVVHTHTQTASASPGNGPAHGGFGRMSIPMALWRRKWWPILPALLFAAFATGFSLTLSDRYQATAQVRVEQHPLGVPSNNVSANSLSNDPTTYLERQARILTSPDMLRRVVERAYRHHGDTLRRFASAERRRRKQRARGVAALTPPST